MKRRSDDRSNFNCLKSIIFGNWSIVIVFLPPMNKAMRWKNELWSVKSVKPFSQWTIIGEDHKYQIKTIIQLVTTSRDSDYSNKLSNLNPTKKGFDKKTSWHVAPLLKKTLLVIHLLLLLVANNFFALGCHATINKHNDKLINFEGVFLPSKVEGK